jgi:threonine/homoserine/homoserine lactone efflux protein
VTMAAMTLQSAILSFAVVAGLLTIIPGMDTALVLRAAITQGRGRAFATAIGINTGALVWGAGAAVGVSALLVASTVAYTVLRIAGAAYMVWLGATMAWSALRHRTTDDLPTGAPQAAGSWWRAWRRGMWTNLVNPKVGAFYVAALPQFIPPDTAHLPVGLLLALVHDIEAMVWFTAIILGAGAARRWLASRRAQRAVDGTTGAVLVGFGITIGLATK